MLLYPGGTVIDPDGQGYSFLENFFSDLGMAHTYGGEAKVLSLILFGSALVLIGVAFVLFFAVMPSIFTDTRLERATSRLGSVGGVLAGVSCIGVGSPLGCVFCYGLAVSFLLAVACYLAAMLKNRDYPNAYAAVFAVYLVILATFAFLMVLGPDVDTRKDLVILAVGQKMAIYSGMMCWFAQFVGALAFHSRHRQYVSRGRCGDVS
jgi:hypothetical membrane protein